MKINYAAMVLFCGVFLAIAIAGYAINPAETPQRIQFGELTDVIGGACARHDCHESNGWVYVKPLAVDNHYLFIASYAHCDSVGASAQGADCPESGSNVNLFDATLDFFDCPEDIENNIFNAAAVTPVGSYDTVPNTHCTGSC